MPETLTVDVLPTSQITNWHGGKLFAFSGLDGSTDFTWGLVGRTAKQPGLQFLLPGVCTVNFPGAREAGWNLLRDSFVYSTEGESLHGAFVDTHHFLIRGRCEIGGKEDVISYLVDGDRTLIGSARAFNPDLISEDLDAVIARRNNWIGSRTIPEGVSPQTETTLLSAFSLMKTQVYTAEGMIQHRWTTPDRWPHRGMWLWDSVFHAIGWRHLDAELAKDIITAVFDGQRDDGFIPHWIRPDETSGITQPPVLALGVKLVDQVAADDAWIEALFPKLAAYVEWSLRNRDTDGFGLLEWYTGSDTNNRCDESGMDNSPRFDTAKSLDATDFNSFVASECRILSGFARRLGLDVDASLWRQRHEYLCNLIDMVLWSDEHSFFMDYDFEKEERSPVVALSGFLPLLCDAASPVQAEALARHIDDPAMFGTPLIVPSVAAKDTLSYSKDMWRGPVWVNYNWLIAYGFMRYGMVGTAQRIIESTKAEIERCHEEFGVFFEFYDDRFELDPPMLPRKGKCAPEISPYHQVIHDLGWTATCYVDMVVGKHWQFDSRTNVV
jgi:hypothetical protein